MSECNHPPVTIVICTVGGRASLDDCIAAAAQQECSRCEMVLVASSGAEPPAAPVSVPMPAVWLRQPRRGVSAARNLAVSGARGEILLFLDDDVVPMPGWLHAMTAAFDERAVECVTGYVEHEGEGFYPAERYREARATSPWRLSREEKDWFDEAMSSDAGYGCNMGFRREFLLKNPFPEDLGAGTKMGAADEHFMFLQVLKSGAKLAHAPGAKAKHRYTEDPAQQKRRILQLIQCASAFRLKLLVEADGLRWQVARSTARRIMTMLRPRGYRLRKKRLNAPLTFWEIARSLLSGPWLYAASRKAND